MGGRRGEYVFFWNPIVNSSAAKIFENLRTNSVSHLKFIHIFSSIHIIIISRKNCSWENLNWDHLHVLNENYLLRAHP